MGAFLLFLNEKSPVTMISTCKQRKKISFITEFYNNTHLYIYIFFSLIIFFNY